MWTLVVIIFVFWFAHGCISSAETGEGGHIALPIFLMIFTFIIFSVFTDGKYLSKDIRVGHVIQYRETQYGKVDSIAYYVNGELVQYNEVNKRD